MAAASLATALGISGCMRKPLTSTLPAAMAPENLPDNPCRLPPVRVSRDRVIRSVVGLRPYRPSGFRVEREQIGDTAVVHNYGHGGGGITLSWGSSKLAVDLGAPGHVGSVAVLGSGVIGLTTARMLQDEGFEVSQTLAMGEPSDEIIKFARDNEVDLIAMSTHGHRFVSDLLYGSTADKVRHFVDVPVLLLKAKR